MYYLGLVAMPYQEHSDSDGVQPLYDRLRANHLSNCYGYGYWEGEAVLYGLVDVALGSMNTEFCGTSRWH